jgi:hypothetical protein
MLEGMKTKLRHVVNPATGESWDALTFWCPGCERVDDDGSRHAGLHMLPVNGPGALSDRASWSWDGNLDAPTLEPSILTRRHQHGEAFVCHSFLRGGVFEFLGDCTHPLAGQHVPLPDLPDWAAAEE